MTSSSEPDARAETDDAPAAESPPWLNRARLLAGVAVVATLALVATAVWMGVQWRQAEDLESTRDEALAAARDDAVTIASYDHRKLDEYFDAVGEIATGDFAEQYVKANKNLRGLLKKTKAVVTAKVIDAGVQSASEDKVVVLLFVDQDVENAATRGKATDRNRMLMTLERHDDGWLVSDLELK